MVSPGGVIATIGWIAVSALFAVYVANFSNYNRTYGALAGIVVFLIWLWLSNIALLMGAEVNAELDHAKAIAKGLPEDVRPFADPAAPASSTSTTNKPSSTPTHSEGADYNRGSEDVPTGVDFG